MLLHERHPPTGAPPTIAPSRSIARRNAVILIDQRKLPHQFISWRLCRITVPPRTRFLRYGGAWSGRHWRDRGLRAGARGAAPFAGGTLKNSARTCKRFSIGPSNRPGPTAIDPVNAMQTVGRCNAGRRDGRGTTSPWLWLPPRNLPMKMLNIARPSGIMAPS